MLGCFPNKSSNIHVWLEFLNTFTDIPRKGSSGCVRVERMYVWFSDPRYTQLHSFSRSFTQSVWFMSENILRTVKKKRAHTQSTILTVTHRVQGQWNLTDISYFLVKLHKQIHSLSLWDKSDFLPFVHLGHAVQGGPWHQALPRRTIWVKFNTPT